MARKCDYCKQQIDTPREHQHNIILFNNKYYHENCFLEKREKMVKSKSKYRNEWENALQDIEKLKKYAEDMIDALHLKDDLNSYLLAHYDIIEVPKMLWEALADLEKGEYRHRACKPVSMRTILECWHWGQQNLDKININNQMNHKGPTNDTDRLRYDLAILIGKVPVFLKEQAKIKASTLEQKKEALAKKDKVNYNTISNNNINDNKPNQDIESLIDEIF